MIVTDPQVSEALTYLSETDESCAKAKAYYMGLDERSKTIKAVEYLRTVGTVGQREAEAYSSVAYEQHLTELQDANADYETMRNKRLTAELRIEVWRSENANRRKGNL